MRPTTASFPIAASVLVGLSAGCGTDTSAGPEREVVVRDSAGVVIVENPADAAARAPEWRLDPHPVLAIGGGPNAEGPLQFTHVPGALALSDGRIAVQEIRTGEVRYFSPDGGHLFTVGGVGDGPGEFRLLSLPAFELGGDSIGLWDLQSRRLTVFDGAGDLLAIRSLPGGAHPFGALDGGALAGYVATSLRLTDDPAEVTRTRTTFLLAIADRPVWDTLVTIVGGGAHGPPPTPGSPDPPVRIPFSSIPAAGSDGRRVVITDGARRELKVFRDGARPERIIRVSTPPDPLTEARFRAEVERRLSAIEDPARRAVMRERYGALPIPATVPSWTGSRVGGLARLLPDRETGEIWVRTFDPVDDVMLPTDEDPPSRWLIFDAEGVVRGTLEVPGGFTPYQAVGGNLLGVQRDALHLESVQLRRVVR